MDALEPYQHVQIRGYVSDDADDTLRIFREAVTSLAAADYTAEQISAWLGPPLRTIDQWDRSMHSRKSYVAVVEGETAAFADVSEHGHIHMMYVSPRFARRGVARQLMQYIEHRARSASAKQVTADVSVTAKPFFEACGFQVVAQQHPVLDGIVLTNYCMSKRLESK